MPSMLSETERGALRDMLHHIDWAERFVQGRTFEQVRDDAMVLYAVIRCLEIISEASRRLSDALKARHPQMPWREMAAAGNSTVTTTRTCCRASSGKPCPRTCRRSG